MVFRGLQKNHSKIAKITYLVYAFVHASSSDLDAYERFVCVESRWQIYANIQLNKLWKKIVDVMER